MHEYVVRAMAFMELSNANARLSRISIQPKTKKNTKNVNQTYAEREK